MALASKRKENFIGLHFFNPVQLMKLVEIIRTEHTSDEAYKLVSDYTAKIKKTSVTTPDTPGFIVNRLLVPYMSQVSNFLINLFIMINIYMEIHTFIGNGSAR